jgi:hypothetical protein
VAGALGSYLPGLAFERWEWDGVAALCLAAYAIGAAAILVSFRASAAPLPPPPRAS